ncbi:hypothetical protein ACIOJD_22400 [Streptomyces sp. NPDC088116]|uniref:hypothetical protein n=1 Tax=Streptomyces sp. NPDC088116 TaxID=3365825 RepID=UPI0038133CE4
MSEPFARAGAAPRLLRAAVFTAVCVVLSATGHALAACATVPWWSLVLGFLSVFAVAAPLAGRARSTATIVVALTGGQLALHTVFGLGQRHVTVPTGTDDALIRMAAKLVCGAGPTSLSHVDAQRILANAGISPAGSAGGTGTGVHHHMAPALGSAASVSASASGSGSVPASVSASADGLLPSLPMVLGHLLAALATGWLLRRGDLALLRLAHLSAHGISDVTDSAPLRALRAALALVRALCAGLPGVPAQEPRAPRASYHAPPPPAAEALQHTVSRRGPPAALLPAFARVPALAA